LNALAARVGWAMVWLAFCALVAWVAYGCLPPG
jgi:hypothetical protein